MFVSVFSFKENHFYENDLSVVDSAVIQSHISTTFPMFPPTLRVENTKPSDCSLHPHCSESLYVFLIQINVTLLETSGKVGLCLIAEVREAFGYFSLLLNMVVVHETTSAVCACQMAVGGSN